MHKMIKQSQLTYTCLKFTMGTLEKGVKYVYTIYLKPDFPKIKKLPVCSFNGLF